MSISPAVSAPASARSASTSTRPLAVEGTDTNLKARHRRRSRVGAVGGVGHEYLFARRIAAVTVIGLDEQQPEELAVRAGGGLEGHRIHASG